MEFIGYMTSGFAVFFTTLFILDKITKFLHENGLIEDLDLVDPDDVLTLIGRMIKGMGHLMVYFFKKACKRIVYDTVHYFD